MIPHIFHRIWLGPDAMPQEYVEYGETWTRLNPGWEMRLWTEQNMPPLVNQREFEFSSTWAGKSNILRYEILSLYGGIYVDTDFECLRPLGSLLDNSDFFGCQIQPGIIKNAIMGAAPGHPLLHEVIRCVPGCFMVNRLQHSPYQTGSIMMSVVINFFLANAKLQNVTFFPASLFYPMTWEQKHVFQQEFDIDRHPEAIAIHHWATSWKN